MIPFTPCSHWWVFSRSKVVAAPRKVNGETQFSGGFCVMSTGRSQSNVVKYAKKGPILFDTIINITLHSTTKDVQDDVQAPSPASVPDHPLVPQRPLHLQGRRGQTLAQAIWLSSMLTPPPLCSSLGRCGRCRVRFLSTPPPPVAAEEQFLSPQALEAGWRLSCRHPVHMLGDNVEIELPPPFPFHRQSKAAQGTPRPVGGPPLLLAVDLGTTSLCWQALSLKGEVVAQGQEINPQMGAGSEVMSRLAAAQKDDGLELLSELVCARLRALVADIGNVTQIYLTANTAMTAILLRRNVGSLASAPYRRPLEGHSVERLPGLPPIYVPALPGPFVGSDISAGLAALLENDPATPFLLADLGTNGEFILYTGPEKSYMASVPMGPALEGIGLTFGDVASSEAGTGIVNSVSLTPAGLQATTLDGGPPRRICAAGYLSLVHVLLQAGILNGDGTFCTEPALPLARKLATRFQRVHGQTRLMLFGDIYLSGEDVEEILKVKAAFSLALEELLKAAELPASSLHSIYLAGALGEHVPAADLEALGFVPQGMGRRLQAVGNTSLQGAALLARTPAKREALARWSADCQLVSLAEQQDFTENYMRHMRFC